jgi:hypothetical protein
MAETMPMMFKDHYSSKADPETMGLGWKTTMMKDSIPLIWHDGGPDEGVGALMAFVPSKKIGIAVIGNGTGFSGSVSLPFAREILDHILEDPGANIPEQDNHKGEVKAKGEMLKNYEGKYVAFGQLLDVKAKKHKLRAHIGPINLNLLPNKEATFRVSHWMDKIGLTRLIKPPIDFGGITIRFVEAEPIDSCLMIINLDRIAYEFCPKYPENEKLPEGWNGIIGEYYMTERLPGNKPGKPTGSILTIQMEENVMIMSGLFGPIVPVSDNYIRILSGPFAGETMEISPESGNIVHQNAVFVPVNGG